MRRSGWLAFSISTVVCDSDSFACATSNASSISACSLATSSSYSGLSGGGGGSEMGFLALRSATFLAFWAFLASSHFFFFGFHSVSARISFASSSALSSSSVQTCVPAGFVSTSSHRESSYLRSWRWASSRTAAMSSSSCLMLSSSARPSAAFFSAFAASVNL